MKDNREALRPYVADMAAVQRHILEAIERQKKDDDMKKLPEVHQLISRLETTLKRQVESLESHIDSFPGGGLATAVKETVTGILGGLAGLYDKIRTETASRNLRDDYTALALATVSYTMLHTSALAFRQNATAELALRFLKELTPFVMEINELIPQVVAREIADEGTAIDLSVTQQAVRNTQEAWRTTTAPVGAL